MQTIEDSCDRINHTIVIEVSLSNKLLNKDVQSDDLSKLDLGFKETLPVIEELQVIVRNFIIDDE